MLLVWLLSIPGIRPVYHDHQIDTAEDFKHAQLDKHLRCYPHDDVQDAAKIHLHWLVQLDGNLFPAFPNNSPAMEQPVKSLTEVPERWEYDWLGSGSLDAYDAVSYSRTFAAEGSPQIVDTSFDVQRASMARLAALMTTRQFSTSL